MSRLSRCRCCVYADPKGQGAASGPRPAFWDGGIPDRSFRRVRHPLPLRALVAFRRGWHAPTVTSRGVPVWFAAQHAPHRRQQRLGHFLLADVTVGAGGERAPDAPWHIVHGQDQHPQTRMAGTDRLQQLQTVARSERKIGDDQVRPQFGDGTQPIARISRLGADDENPAPRRSAPSTRAAPTDDCRR